MKAVTEKTDTIITFILLVIFVLGVAAALVYLNYNGFPQNRWDVELYRIIYSRPEIKETVGEIRNVILRKDLTRSRYSGKKKNGYYPNTEIASGIKRIGTAEFIIIGDKRPAIVLLRYALSEDSNGILFEGLEILNK